MFPQVEPAEPISDRIGPEAASVIWQAHTEAGAYWFAERGVGGAVLPSIVVLSGEETFLCETADVDGAPQSVLMTSRHPFFKYCRGQDTVVIPAQPANYVYQVGGASLLKFVVYHEDGHWVQDMVGSEEAAEDANKPSAHEDGANCLAGIGMAATSAPAELAQATQAMTEALHADESHGNQQNQINAFNWGITTGDCSAYGVTIPPIHAA